MLLWPESRFSILEGVGAMGIIPGRHVMQDSANLRIVLLMDKDDVVVSWVVGTLSFSLQYLVCEVRELGQDFVVLSASAQRSFCSGDFVMMPSIL